MVCKIPGNFMFSFFQELVASCKISGGFCHEQAKRFNNKDLFPSPSESKKYFIKAEVVTYISGIHQTMLSIKWNRSSTSYTAEVIPPLQVFYLAGLSKFIINHWQSEPQHLSKEKIFGVTGTIKVWIPLLQCTVLKIFVRIFPLAISVAVLGLQAHFFIPSLKLKGKKTCVQNKYNAFKCNWKS